jgi:hypothetical protein
MSKDPRAKNIQPTPLKIRFRVPSPTVWQAYPFALEWYADALREARIVGDHNARRREILFAVCCAESYLLEWVRDEVLKKDYKRLIDYFPPGRRRPVVAKWKEIPKQLKKDGLIPGVPNYGENWWEEWRELVENYRDGLVHASSSRPESSSQTPKSNPAPSKTALDQLPAGWAVGVVTSLIRNLHHSVGTPVPSWIIEP